MDIALDGWSFMFLHSLLGLIFLLPLSLKFILGQLKNDEKVMKKNNSSLLMFEFYWTTFINVGYNTLIDI